MTLRIDFFLSMKFHALENMSALNCQFDNYFT